MTDSPTTGRPAVRYPAGRRGVDQLSQLHRRPGIAPTRGRQGVQQNDSFADEYLAYAIAPISSAAVAVLVKTSGRPWRLSVPNPGVVPTSFRYCHSADTLSRFLLRRVLK